MDLVTLLAIACLPALGFQIGAAVAEVFDPPPWFLGGALHAAAWPALSWASAGPKQIALASAAVTACLITKGLPILLDGWRGAKIRSSVHDRSCAIFGWL